MAIELFKQNTTNIINKLIGFDYILDNSKNIVLVYSEDYTNNLKNMFWVIEKVYVIIEYHMFNFLEPEGIREAIRLKTFSGCLYSSYPLLLCFPENNNILISSSDFLTLDKYIILKNDVTYS